MGAQQNDELSVDAGINEVRLVGRLAAPAEEKTLPSGDTLVTFRVVVARVPDEKRRAKVDTLECVAWASRPKRSALSWRGDDVIEVHGRLCRRFFRSGAGAASRTEVEVTRAKVVRRARTG